MSSMPELERLAADVQSAVDQNDWEDAARCEQQLREELSRRIDEIRQNPALDDGEVRNLLEAAIERVSKLIGEVSHHERRVAREATMVATGRQAAAAYAQGG